MEYEKMETAALLIVESGLSSYEPEIMWELAKRADMETLWFNAEYNLDFEDAYKAIIEKLTSQS
jgi:hypothetical protein